MSAYLSSFYEKSCPATLKKTIKIAAIRKVSLVNSSKIWNTTTKCFIMNRRRISILTSNKKRNSANLIRVLPAFTSTRRTYFLYYVSIVVVHPLLLVQVKVNFLRLYFYFYTFSTFYNTFNVFKVYS